LICRQSAIDSVAACAGYTLAPSTLCNHLVTPSACNGLVLKKQKKENFVITQTFKIGRLFIVAMAFAALAGCSISPIVSRSGSSTADLKLVSARVVWVEAQSFPIKIIKSEQYGRATINESDKAETQRIVSQLVAAFRNGAPAGIRAQLAPYKVNDGGDATIELTPVTSFVVVGKDRVLHVKAAIRRSDSTAEIWSVTIRVSGKAQDGDQVLVDKFLVAMMNELKSAGWVS
jgi:hypothetical protein